MPAPFEAIERSAPGPMPRHSARTPLAATICRMIDTLDIPRYFAPSLLLDGHRQWGIGGFGQAAERRRSLASAATRQALYNQAGSWSGEWPRGLL
jgi:hypothetical protein